MCLLYGMLMPSRGDALPSIVLQDEEEGGISDQPEDMADVYHTFFGIAGLSLMGHPGLERIDPTVALPTEVIKHLELVSPAGTKPRPGVLQTGAEEKSHAGPDNA